jgi:7,8-dihydropterin-6-yl-methyl-4-(beta-D-ribofuranosyl)aminobenzene 5'-phosphate synthase
MIALLRFTAAAISALAFSAWAHAAPQPELQGATVDAMKPRLTVLYDAFGKASDMQKDWGYSALVEAGGKRILFDTGNDPVIFANNVKAKGVDLATIDFVVMSHRHSDHMGGLAQSWRSIPGSRFTLPKRASGSLGRRCPRASIARLKPCQRRCATSTAPRPKS